MRKGEGGVVLKRGEDLDNLRREGNISFETTSFTTAIEDLWRRSSSNRGGCLIWVAEGE